MRRLLIQSVTYSAFGLLGGAGLSLFFKKKVPVMGYATGFGLGLAIHKNGHGLIQHVFGK